MSTYRVGNHQPQNVYRDNQYIGVMFTAEDAALVVEALNGLHVRAGGEWDNAKPYRIYSRWVKAQDHTNRSVYDAILEAYAVGLATEPGEPKPAAADLCTDERQSPHPARSRPNMCTTCSEASTAPASTCLGCNVARRGGPLCPAHDIVLRDGPVRS